MQTVKSILQTGIVYRAAALGPQLNSEPFRICGNSAPGFQIENTVGKRECTSNFKWLEAIAKQLNVKTRD